MRTPNPEQKLAIEHGGGVVLRAGAGSGKTFVLVEHFVYLMEKFHSELKIENSIELKQKLKKYLSSLVFMTFTKKAAAELEIRLQKRIDDQGEFSGESFWASVKEELSALTISTIHGYCFKLISQGFFPNIDPKVAIISEKAQADRITELTNEWLLSLDSRLDKEIHKQILLSRKTLIQSMDRIFSDPEIRSQWNKREGEHEDLSFASFYREMVLEAQSDIVLKPLSLPDGGKKPPAYLGVLENYNEMLRLGEELKPSDFNAVFEKARLTPPKNNEEVAEYIRALSPIRKVMKAQMDSLVAYYEEERVSCAAWREALFSLFSYIEENYLNVRGITFSDLEYYVLRGLESDEVCSLISNNYKYFVVDEFQDTSEIQYQILDRLILGDSKRLFCVGDLKQAIYGFRGGDIGVFRKTMKRVPLNLDLKLNYRSSRSVIEFNNSLFSCIMPKGTGYKDLDKHAVDFEAQDVPPTCGDEGLIGKISIELGAVPPESKKWPSNGELNKFEAQAIAGQISAILDRDSNEEIAILYSKLAPSFDLIGLLMKMDCSFSAQVKILSSEDPVLSMCSLLVQIDESTKKESVVLLLNAYLTILDVEKKVSPVDLEMYQRERTLWGELEALLRFFWRLGFSNSNYAETYERLRDLSVQAGGAHAEFVQKLSEGKDERYSIEFQYSGKPSHIQIMTAHASKGLEFKHVFLGGIYTNGRKMPSLERIGLSPGSFKWSPKGVKGDTFTTPQFILEQKREALKNFSEAKRLFYVACTRAQSALYWVNLTSEELSVRCENDSWIVALREWEEETCRADLVTHINIDLHVGASALSNIPFFHFDGLGVYEKKVAAPELVTLTDLSVTRLATLAICPRKFYLKNILKFDQLEDIDFNDESEVIENQLFEDTDSEMTMPFVKMSVDDRIQRGLRLHELIHEMIARGNTTPLKSDSEDLRILKNVQQRIAEHLLAKREVFSETALKFDFFGHMISGIPDFFVIDHNTKTLEVWDFKTGKAAEEKDLIYWFQVACYGYALSKQYSIDSIKLALYYIDNDEFKSLDLNSEQNTRFLERTWQRIYKLDQVNKDHCSTCEFGKLCQGQGECVAPVKLSDMI